MAEKTGLDLLTELVEQVKLLNKKVDLLDQNVKSLMNQSRAKPEQKPQVKPQLKPAEPPAPKKGKMTMVKDGKETKPKAGVMTSGKLMVMVDSTSTPIPDAAIKVYDENDKVVKETKTNRGGVWMALLQPGNYVVEISGKFKGKDLVTQNKNFTIPEGVQQFEVN